LTHVSFRTTRSSLCRYQLNTFGDRFFDSRALGLELASFYLAEVLGAALAGWTLDTASTPRAGALRQLAAFGLATSAAYALALSVEVPAARAHWPTCSTPRLQLGEEGVAVPSLAFFLWGLSDSQVQAYAYWLLRQLHSGGDELARAVGFYKMVQSLGWSVGFLLVPSWRLPPLVQNLATAACGALGLALALRELPPARIDSRSSSPLLRVVRIEGERVDESAVESAGGALQQQQQQQQQQQH